MITKFNNYINENTSSTYTISCNTGDIPLINIDEYYRCYSRKLYKIINFDNVVYDGKEYSAPEFYDELFSKEIFRDILFEKIKEFCKEYIYPSLIKLNIGIKNIIPRKISNENPSEKYELDFDLIVSKNFCQYVLDYIQKNKEKINSGTSEIKMFFDVESLVKTLEYLIKNDKPLNWTQFDDIAPFLNYISEITKNPYPFNWNQIFEMFLINDKSIKDPYQYIKKELKQNDN